MRLAGLLRRDYTEAVKWYRLSAEQGYAAAQNRLGVCYASGRGVAQDYGKAVKWYRKAAEQGNAFAQNNLGRCYSNGRGVARDYAEAAKWYRKAAEQGSRLAQINLRNLESRGVVVANSSENYPATVTGSATSEPTDSTSEDPLTLDEIKLLSSAGDKAEAIIAKIKETNAKFGTRTSKERNKPILPLIKKSSNA